MPKLLTEVYCYVLMDNIYVVIKECHMMRNVTMSLRNTGMDQEVVKSDLSTAQTKLKTVSLNSSRVCLQDPEEWYLE